MSEFDKIIGYADIKDELIRFCDVLKNFVWRAGYRKDFVS